jgi:hypothetical protein
MRALPLGFALTPLGQHAQQGGIGTNHRLDTHFTRVCSNRIPRKYCTYATQPCSNRHTTQRNEAISQSTNQSTNQPNTNQPISNQSAINVTLLTVTSTINQRNKSS